MGQYSSDRLYCFKTLHFQHLRRDITSKIKKKDVSSVTHHVACRAYQNARYHFSQNCAKSTINYGTVTCYPKLTLHPRICLSITFDFVTHQFR
mmetsp:Transcript_25307/g.31134  ORF Transcript_25307/g.31134 Transcript_25307/m.31134 type:complete len:93 (-) Transcript_25307:271-549(-)